MKRNILFLVAAAVALSAAAGDSVRLMDEFPFGVFWAWERNEFNHKSAGLTHEQYAEKDKKQKEAADVKNNADSMLFQIEKTLEENGDKISEEDKTAIKEASDKLRATIATNDTEAIKADTEALNKVFYPVMEKLY